MNKNILRITMIVILLVTMMCVSGCGNSTNDNSDRNNNDDFIIVSTQEIANNAGNKKYLTIMYDPDTLVMYSTTYGGSGKSNPSELTPLYNSDGTLKLYTPNAETTEN